GLGAVPKRGSAGGGRPTRQIRPIIWGRDGWPSAGEPRIPVGEKGNQRVNFESGSEISLLAGGVINSSDTRATWSLRSSSLRLRWPRPGAPGGASVDD